MVTLDDKALAHIRDNIRIYDNRVADRDVKNLLDEVARLRDIHSSTTERLAKTTWSIEPITTFSAGEVLLPMREFPSNCHMVRVRKIGEYHPCGVIKGDGADELLRTFADPLPPMVITSVSEISGWCNARLQVDTVVISKVDYDRLQLINKRLPMIADELIGVQNYCHGIHGAKRAARDVEQLVRQLIPKEPS